MFRGIFTGLSTARKALQRVSELEDEVERIRKAALALAERMQSIEASHLKLRGKVYGDGLHKQHVEPQSREERRAQAFALRGIVPGRATNLA